MSKLTKDPVVKPLTVAKILAKKSEKQAVSMITCYDGAFGKIVERTSVDLVLVGDSLGNVMLGYEDTLKVTMDDMVRHSAAVTRVVKRPFVIADMPFGSYHESVAQAVHNACRLVREGGVKAVKLEGGRAMRAQIEAIVAAGIPVMGHLGLTPQSVHTLSGYRVQGRDASEARRILEDAQVLEDAGCFAVVLEMVPAALAQEITSTLAIPTIGIGAGAGTSGQVLVLHDLLGFDEDFKPKFVKHYANMGALIHSAVESYVQEVEQGTFPDDDHSFR